MITEGYPEGMLKDSLMNLIGPAIVASARAIKVYNLDVFSKKEYTITPEQYLVLNMIATEDQPSQTKLCKLLYKDKSNITRLLAVLEEKQLIEKSAQKENNKSVNKICITKKGKTLRDEITPVIKKERCEYLKDITDDEMYNCIKTLFKIQENISKKD